MNAVNLMPSSRRLARRRGRRVRAWSVGLAAYLGAVAIGWLATTGMGSAALDSVAEQMEKADAGIEKTRKDIARLTPRIKKLEQELDAALSVGVHPDWSVLLRRLAALQPERVSLQTCELKLVKQAPPAPKPGAAASATKPAEPPPLTVLRLTGVGENMQTVAEYTARLEEMKKAGVFRNVSRGETHGEKDRLTGQDRTWFSIECVLEDQPPPKAVAAKGTKNAPGTAAKRLAKPAEPSAEASADKAAETEDRP